MPTPTLEVPVDSFEAALLAAPFATRLELCDDLPSEGWSPDWDMVRRLRAATDVHLVAMIRPRFRGAVADLVPAAFHATGAFMDACMRDIQSAAAAGADSVAISALDADGHVDRTASIRLCQEARRLGMEVAFLRTFDLLADRERGMRDITELGFVRVVTAGVYGWDASVRTLDERLDALAADTARARMFAAPIGRVPVEIVPGGGVRAANARDFMRISMHLHASCRREGVISSDELQALRTAMCR
jgi:copper homeostasis protein